MEKIDMESKVNERFQRKQINLSKISESDLKKLKTEEEIVIKHPIISGLEITIGEEVAIQEVLGVPTVFKSVNKKIKDNRNNVFPTHKVSLNNNKIVEYINSLIKCETLGAFQYCRSLYEAGVKVGDRIKFDDGKSGVIADYTGDEYTPNLKYIPIKKNGEISKIAPRIIYAGVKYTISQEN